MLIKTKNKSKTFRFKETHTDEIKKSIEISDRKPKKASQKFDMGTNILRQMQPFSPITSAIMSML